MRSLFAALLLSAPLTALAQPLATPSAAPAANPAPRAAAASAAPAANPAAPGSTAPGSTARPTAPGDAAANPHGGASLPQDESFVAGDLPAGVIEAFVLDSKRTPLANTRVRLGIMFQKISEGESRSERFATTDADGRVRFNGLSVGSDYSYRITVKSGPADYGSSPFNLGASAGHRVRLHVFPVTTDVSSAPVGVRALIYVEPRDDVFQFEALFRVFNVGTVTWVPKDIVMTLPEGFKAFSAQKEMTGAGFSLVDGVGARLEGTFAPGQYDVRFRFQTPKSSDETATFRLGMLPRTVDVGVIVEAAAQMNMRVDGFRETLVDSNPEGKRVLVARRNFSLTDNVPSYDVHLSGLPVPGPGRWIAVLVASALGLTGFAAYRGVVQLEAGSSDVRDRDLERARELLLAEIVEVERSHRAGDLGPRAYAEARRTLLESLARLGKDALTLKKPKRRRERQPA